MALRRENEYIMCDYSYTLFTYSVIVSKFTGHGSGRAGETKIFQNASRSILRWEMAHPWPVQYPRVGTKYLLACYTGQLGAG